MPRPVTLFTGQWADLPLAQLAPLAKSMGYDGLAMAETAHDPFLPLVLAAEHTRRVELITSIAVAFARNPMILAGLANDLNAYSKGRFILGLGSQIRPHIEHRYGATWDRPVARMREMVLAVKAILTSWQEGSRLDFRGEFTRHTLMPPTFVPGPNPYGVPPVLLGALGPQMTRTAAEVADGLLVMPFHSHRHFRERTLPAVAEGLELAGRERVDLYPQAIVAMGDTPEEIEAASLGVKALLAFYGSTPAYKPVLDVEGWGDLQPELNALSKTGDIMTMIGLIDDTMMRTLAVAGTPAECATEIRNRFGDVAERVCAYFPGSTHPQERIASLATELRAGRRD